MRGNCDLDASIVQNNPLINHKCKRSRVASWVWRGVNDIQALLLGAQRPISASLNHSAAESQGWVVQN